MCISTATVNRRPAQRRIDLRAAPAFGGRRMAGITTADVRALIAARLDANATPGEVNRELSLLEGMQTLALQPRRLMIAAAAVGCRRWSGRLALIAREPLLHHDEVGTVGAPMVFDANWTEAKREEQPQHAGVVCEHRPFNALKTLRTSEIEGMRDQRPSDALSLGFRPDAHRKQLEYPYGIRAQNANGNHHTALVQSAEVPNASRGVLLKPGPNEFRFEWALRETEEPQILRSVPDPQKGREQLIEVASVARWSEFPDYVHLALLRRSLFGGLTSKRQMSGFAGTSARERRTASGRTPERIIFRRRDDDKAVCKRIFERPRPGAPMGLGWWSNVPLRVSGGGRGLPEQSGYTHWREGAGLARSIPPTPCRFFNRNTVGVTNRDK
jgi:hypothetical protein